MKKNIPKFNTTNVRKAVKYVLKRNWNLITGRFIERDLSGRNYCCPITAFCIWTNMVDENQLLKNMKNNPIDRFDKNINVDKWILELYNKGTVTNSNAFEDFMTAYDSAQYKGKDYAPKRKYEKIGYKIYNEFMKNE